MHNLFGIVKKKKLSWKILFMATIQTSTGFTGAIWSLQFSPQSRENKKVVDDFQIRNNVFS